MKKDFKFWIFFSLAALETIILFWFSVLSSVGTIETGFMRLGDLEHFIAYAVYGFLLNQVAGYYMNRRRALIVSVLIGSFVGGLSESIQHFIPYRTGDVLDWAADTIGSFAGALVSSGFKPFFINKLKPRGK